MAVVVTPGAEQYYAKINALKAMVNLVEVDEETFRAVLRSRPHPTLVTGRTGALWFKKSLYMTSHDGFVFLFRSNAPVDFSQDAAGALCVEAKGIQIPFL